MAIKCFPAPLPTASFMRAMKYCFRILGSSVEPDLLDTRMIVFARSTLCSAARTCAGSVESTTERRGNPCCWPNVPPAPQDTNWSHPYRAATHIESQLSECFWRVRESPQRLPDPSADAPRYRASPSTSTHPDWSIRKRHGPTGDRSFPFPNP